MSTYVMSDLHGEYEMFLKMLDKINFSSEDTLYIVGDVMDRGPKPITLLKKLLSMDNVQLLYGNHDMYALYGLKLLNSEITEEFLENLTPSDLGEFKLWRRRNEGQTTVDEFLKLSPEERVDIIDALENDFALVAPIVVNNQKYVLVHAGLNNYEERKDNLEEYTIAELLEKRIDYTKQITDKVKIISGHTRTVRIDSNPNKGYIFQNGCYIAIDCGASYEGGRLACLRLDDMQEYYVEREDNEK